MPTLSVILIGHDTLALHCGRIAQEAGHRVAAVVTRHPAVRDWAEAAGLRVVAPGPGLADRLGAEGVDWVLSVANLDIVPKEVLARARHGGVNFHDGPLPRYAGLNAPVWAILNGEAEHGITWHLMQGGVDEGPILLQRRFEIAPDETALSLNGKCYAAAIDTFPELLAALAAGPRAEAQDLRDRTLFRRDALPPAGGRIDFGRPAAEVARLVRALDHGDYPNPLCCPKILHAGRVILVGRAEVAGGAGAPGQVLDAGDGALTVACAAGAVRLSRLRAADGTPLPEGALPPRHAVLPAPDAAEAEAIGAALAAARRDEGYWRERLRDLRPAPLPLEDPGAAPGAPLTRDLPLPAGASPEAAFAAFAALIAEAAGGQAVDLLLARPGGIAGHVAAALPVRFDPDDPGAFGAALDAARLRAPHAADLPARLGQPLPATPAVGLSGDAAAGLVPGTALTLAAGPQGLRLTADPARISARALDLIAERLSYRIGGGAGLPPSEAALIASWSGTAVPHARLCLHDLVAAQAARTPDAPALIFEDRTLTHAQVEAAANRVAHVLRAAGVARGSFVGLHVRRSPEMVIGALAILKAGGAYVPLDPAYPADRIGFCIADSGAGVILTESALAAGLPAGPRAVLIDADPGIAAAPATPPDSGVTPEDLAYLIHTSGSTGRPKGVMVEHGNLAAFVAGMDALIAQDPPGTWLAVTSLSFDISVLELFWTLARGFRVVIASDEDRVAVARGSVGSGPGMDFSLFYWGNDDGAGGRDKYRLLLEGARFADDNGFAAIWTPERHFHAFGGPYPNPSVTGAAVAAVTRNIAVRAGSCVAPLHHPARIAEEWAVIDNLTGGRAGLAIASGWQPDDFVLRPENAPPANKAAMLRSIDQLRRLWAGEAVEFPAPGGGSFAVRTQPRPVSKELPLWITTAGNPETWREAGAIGANVLTHLLGQSIAELEGKIALYHEALRAAGHDPARHIVTLMLHTCLAATREEARERARGPMKDYLRSAAGLIRQYAWAFPAFRKPQGAATPMDIDLRSLPEEELDAILDFAFLRYFDESGLFGTVEDALLRVAELRRIGVGEVACLIDYGIPTATVLEGLKLLAEVRRRANAPAGPAAGDFSIAAQIVRHGVTHLQCTPSMARMLITNDDSRAALARLRHLLIGGEALPGALVADLARATRATITNMYGPTETTIWSTTAPADARAAIGPIGRPIANTTVHVLDDAMRPVPVGVAGELWIGGAGVARGYWQRPDLTAERFLPDPFAPGGRLYRTGDLARWRPDGSLDFLGRRDHQVKLRGYRIEPGEIEAALDAASGVVQSVVLAREDVPGVVQLVAYVTADGAVEEAALKAQLARKLPAHMVPARIVRIDAFPLTPNGKVDRKALPRPPAPTLAPRTADGPAPHSAAVSAGAAQAAGPTAGPADAGGSLGRIAAIWSRLLGVEGIGPKDNFFDLGGHSLLAVQAHRDIRAELGAAHLSITDIFRYPTLGALAARVDEGRSPPRPAGQAPRAPGPGAPPPADDPGRADAMARRRALRARRADPG